MQYIEYIEESKTWKCPKSGKWKVICVGGGSSGGYFYRLNVSQSTVNPSYSDQNIHSSIISTQSSGGSTSFGSYLTVNGGESYSYTEYLELVHPYVPATSFNTSGPSHDGSVKGQNGFDGISPYSINTDNFKFMKVQGKGYGAGGGVLRGLTDLLSVLPNVGYIIAEATGTYFYNNPGGSGGHTLYTRIYTEMLNSTCGLCGDIKTTIIDIDENEEIPCTIGSGGKVIETNESNITAICDNLYNQLKSKQVSSSTQNGSVTYTHGNLTYYSNDLASILNTNAKSGKDGVIILQYLGG